MENDFTPKMLLKLNVLYPFLDGFLRMENDNNPETLPNVYVLLPFLDGFLPGLCTQTRQNIAKGICFTTFSERVIVGLEFY